VQMVVPAHDVHVFMDIAPTPSSPRELLPTG
jgi:hypothetical protein